MVERESLRRHGVAALEDRVELDALSTQHLVTTAADGAVDPHAAFADPLLQPAARKVAEECR